MTDEHKTSEGLEDQAISRLYRLTRKEEPSALLDAKVLAEAESNIRRRRRHWFLPLSTAAVVLLGVTLTLRMMEQVPRMPETLEEVAPEQSAVNRSSDMAVEKHILSPSVMMKESKPKSDEQKLFNTQKSARRHMPAGMSKSSPDRVEAMEFSDIDQPVADSLISSDAPEVWLSRIERLWQSGDTQQALQELRAFTKTYPDYPLTEKNQALLNSPSNP